MSKNAKTLFNGTAVIKTSTLALSCRYNNGCFFALSKTKKHPPYKTFFFMMLQDKHGNGLSKEEIISVENFLSQITTVATRVA